MLMADKNASGSVDKSGRKQKYGNYTAQVHYLRPVSNHRSVNIDVVRAHSTSQQHKRKSMPNGVKLMGVPSKIDNQSQVALQGSFGRYTKKRREELISENKNKTNNYGQTL